MHLYQPLQSVNTILYYYIAPVHGGLRAIWFWRIRMEGLQLKSSRILLPFGGRAAGVLYIMTLLLIDNTFYALDLFIPERMPRKTWKTGTFSF